MKEYKIPLTFQCTGIIRVKAKNLNEACFIANGYPTQQPEQVTICPDAIALVDERQLEVLYPAESRQIREDAKPEWEKRGWKQDSTDDWSKGNARICNSFDDVGWGFEGTVWIGSNGKSGFGSLEEAMDWAERNM